MDKNYLKIALDLAKKGLGWTNPNPMVGAILVNDGKIIGQGYHKQVGLAHAEVEAFKNCKESTKGATLYVTLEPCSHFGKTAPCTKAIIKAKIKKVVCCTLDPNQKNHGQGIEQLKKVGIEVETGILEKEARVLNEAFFTFHEKNRPFVVLKFAASLDGKMATHSGDSKWITNDLSREFARGLRGEYQAVLVGINTVLKDDPHLGVRIKGKKDPIRIILDPKSQIPKNAQVLRDKNVMIINQNLTIPDLLEQLRQKEIISVLVEGGGTTLGNFVDSGLVDKVYVFQAPIIVGGEQAISVGGQGANKISEALRLSKVSFKRFGDDMLTCGYVAVPQ